MPSERRAASLYLGLSAATGFLEIGSVIATYQLGHNTVLALAAGAAYQAATALHSVVSVPRIGRCTLALMAIATIVFSFEAALAWVLVPSTFALAVLLQTSREEAASSSHVSKGVKRASRILGFAAAGLCGSSALLAFGCLLCVIQLVRPGKPSSAPVKGVKPDGWGGALMTLHHAHYFAYAYTLVLVLMSAGIPVATVGVCFGIGWISYALTPKLLRGGPPLRTLIAGHTVVAVALMMMATSPGLALLLTLWVITGFGGGTVFCIERLALAWGPGRVTSLETFENAGHVLGCSAALLVSLAGGGHSGAFILGACFAVITILLSIVGEVAHRTRDRVRRGGSEVFG